MIGKHEIICISGEDIVWIECELPNEPGIYFIWNDKNEVVYVGTSECLANRLKKSMMRGKYFSYIVVRENRTEWEKYFIHTCNPIQNIMCNNKKNESPQYPNHLQKYAVNRENFSDFWKRVFSEVIEVQNETA